MYVENVRGQSSIYLQKVGVTIVDYTNFLWNWSDITQQQQTGNENS